MHILGENLHSVYQKLVNEVSGGRHSQPRNLPVVECELPISWTLNCPEQWVLAIPGRRLNPYVALAEVVWMWSGKSGAEFITFYNSNMNSFLDKGIPYFNAAYGARVRHAGYREIPFRDSPSPYTNGGLTHEPVEVDQLHHVISKLQSDPDTRQAVVSLWDPIKDNFHISKDHPCNNMVYFSNRDGHLNITVVIRSNDIIWGVPYNMTQFVHLQALIAGTLGLKMGWFTVMCNNLHYYVNLYPPTLKTVMFWAKESLPDSVEKVGRILHQPTWDMRWNLDAFDLFVREVWEPIEKALRQYPDLEDKAENCNPWFQIQHMRLEDFLQRYDVPTYWRHVFTVMFLCHCRKNEALQVFYSLVVGLPIPMRWLIEDFHNTGDII